MRPLRLLFAVFAFLLTITVLSYIAASRTSSNPYSSSDDARLRSLYSWHAPSSLFPPSAVISLTDDNSTFFLSRPANFGPLLPSRGFSGQLWIGSGFGDDNLGHGGVAGAEGELGCSDVPGWTAGSYSRAGSKVESSSGRTVMTKTGVSMSKEMEQKTSNINKRDDGDEALADLDLILSLIHISEPTRPY